MNGGGSRPVAEGSSDVVIVAYLSRVEGTHLWGDSPWVMESRWNLLVPGTTDSSQKWFRMWGI